MSGDIVIFQSRWRRSVESPSDFLKRYNWVDRTLNLADIPEEPAPVVEIGKARRDRRKKLKAQAKRPELDIFLQPSEKFFDPAPYVLTERPWWERNRHKKFVGNATILRFPFKLLARVRAPRRMLPASVSKSSLRSTTAYRHSRGQ